MNDELRSNASIGGKIAVVGTGMASLGCAEILVQKGFQITIFESKFAPGGLLVYEIKKFKLDQDGWLEKREEFEHADVKFVPNIGKDKIIDRFFEEGFDAVFIDIGSEINTKMEDTPGTDLPGVYESTDFLIRAYMDPNQLPENMRKSLEIGRRVVVIGDGNTAPDCLRIALRLGSEDVICLYYNTDDDMRKTAREEEVKYRFLTQPVRFIAGADGKLAAVECVEMKLGEPDATGRRKPVAVENSNFSVAADTAIITCGYYSDPIISWGLISIKDKIKNTTLREGVFTAEYCTIGSDLVSAIESGRKAALAIDEYLQNKK